MSIVVFCLGATAIVAGVALVSIPAGLIAGGVIACVTSIGYARSEA